MAYAKQNAITNGNNAVAIDLMENFEDARRYIDTGIISGDIPADTIDTPEITKGELSTVAGNYHQFTCGDGYGNFMDVEPRNFTAFSNTSKQEVTGLWTNQATGASTPPDTMIASQIGHLTGTIKEFTLPHRALVTYRCFLNVRIPPAANKYVLDTTKYPEHNYTTYLYVTTDGGDSTEAFKTKGYFYDECVFSSAGATLSSWGGPVTQDPMRDGAAGDGFSAVVSATMYRRQYSMVHTAVLAAGSYKWGVVYDAHHPAGFIECTNVTLETEFVGSNIS